jgi:hypothetical protein
MCRWFAYISPTEPCLLSDVLITPANSISKQCSEHYLPKLLPHKKDKDLDHTSDELLRMRNSLLNMDGLGVACTFTLLTISYHLRRQSCTSRIMWSFLERDLALIKRYPKDVYIIKCPAFPDITPLSR